MVALQCGRQLPHCRQQVGVQLLLQARVLHWGQQVRRCCVWLVRIDDRLFGASCVEPGRVRACARCVRVRGHAHTIAMTCAHLQHRAGSCGSNPTCTPPVGADSHDADAVSPRHGAASLGRRMWMMLAEGDARSFTSWLTRAWCAPASRLASTPSAIAVANVCGAARRRQAGG
jgi:hypothetical protein